MKITKKKLLQSARPGIIFIFFCMAFLFQVKASFAEPSQSHQSETSSSQDSQYVSIIKAAIKSATEGPATISLIDQGSLHLPEDYLFIPKNEASAVMKANGTLTKPSFVGVIFDKKDDIHGLIMVEFIKSGYLRDVNAKNWTADELMKMKSLKKKNDEANKDRVTNSSSPVEIVDWIEPPKYDAPTHKLVWSILAKNKEISSEQMVLYNTSVLGREGYFNFNLITSNSSIAQGKYIVHKILSSLRFNNGKRYEDFNESTDRVAEYGLAALITGIAAKKLGLLALAGVFLIKIWKIAIVIPIILLWGRIKNLFTNKKDKASDETSK